jgi:type VI secretion system FHA domain protein
MSLLITIVRSPDNIALTESSRTFTDQGGCIGRAAGNDWVLQDPERYLSSRHCQVASENGQYYLVDMSTNGTFVNGAMEPLGKGNRVALNNGDRFSLGDYEFQVSLAAAPAAASPFGQPTPAADPLADDDIFGSPSSPFDSPFGAPAGHVSSSEPLFSAEKEETDPLAALDKAGASADPFSSAGMGRDPFASTPRQNPFAGPSHSDGADPLNQSVSWPDSIPESGGIPEDWDDDLSLTPAAPPRSTPLSEPSPPPRAPAAAPAPPQPAPPPVDAGLSAELEARQKELEQANQALSAEVASLKQQLQTKAVSNGTVAASDRVLIEALGLGDRNLSDAEILEISRTIGGLIREMVAGLMQVLSSRSSIKNEFRMSVTTIQPVENNPLKFSVNVDDALENMFIKKGNAYKKPVDAVQEGFQGIAEHQMAILAGIRAAFKGVIERFDPITLEKRFDKQNKGGLIPGIKNAKNWELFCDYYNEVAGDLDNSFQYLFGDEFVRAYEDQLQRLAIARKARKT